MPGISFSFGRSPAMTSSTDIVRSDRGFSSTNIRPVFPPPVALLPVARRSRRRWTRSDPLRMTSATFNWCCTMSLKLIPCAASVLTLNRPWSSLGRKPFGTTTNR